jgi:hypothetical protein
MMKNSFILFLLALPLLLQAQERQAVKGRVFSGNLGVKEALVVNFTTQAETKADSLGNFSLAVQTGDLLIISNYAIETKKIRYTSDLVKNGLLLLEVNMTVEELEEVVIQRSRITSESLGIPMGKAYTVQERRLRAGSSDPIGSLINLLSGRTKMLKANVELEKKVTAKEMLDELPESFYIEELKLKQEQIAGFKFYAAENGKLREELKNAGTGTVKFTLAALAEEYKKVSNEK